MDTEIMNEEIIKEILVWREFQKMQEESLRRSFSKDFNTNNKSAKLWTKIRRKKNYFL